MSARAEQTETNGFTETRTRYPLLLDPSRYFRQEHRIRNIDDPKFGTDSDRHTACSYVDISPLIDVCQCLVKLRESLVYTNANLPTERATLVMNNPDWASNVCGNTITFTPEEVAKS